MPAASIRDATRDVWANNLEDEMRILRRLIDDFPFVSMVRVAGPSLVYYRVLTKWLGNKIGL
jgi:hypothetical protein